MRRLACLIEPILSGWNQFWFSPQPIGRMTLPRVLICAVTACWFASFWTAASVWLAADGVLSTELSARLLESDSISRWQQWSPLWWTESAGLLRAWLMVGIALSLLCALRVGGRWTQLWLWLWAIAWAHRIVVLSGILEPALMSALGYLIIQPGAPLRGWRRSQAADVPATATNARGEFIEHWTAAVALRLLQTHWWLLVATGLLSQLAGLIWWRGEGMWWLAAAERSNLVGLELLRNRPLLVNTLSHAMIVVQLLALWTVSVPRLRTLGIAAGVLVAVVYGGLADHFLYALGLLALLSSFASQPTRSSVDPTNTDHSFAK